MNQTTLLMPFSDAVNQSQQVFRHLLKAMSEPGTLIDLSDVIDDTKDVLSTGIFPSTWCAAQSLLDSETTIYLSPLMAQSDTVKSVQFYTNVSVIQNAKASEFSILSLDELRSLADFNCGTVIAPHTSTTLLVQVNDINDGSGVDGDDIVLTLSGPGIRETKSLVINGLQQSHCELLKNNHQLYPCGIDIVFCAPTKVSAVVRSTAITWEKN